MLRQLPALKNRRLCRRWDGVPGFAAEQESLRSEGWTASGSTRSRGGQCIRASTPDSSTTAHCEAATIRFVRFQDERKNL